MRTVPAMGSCVARKAMLQFALPRMLSKACPVATHWYGRSFVCHRQFRGFRGICSDLSSSKGNGAKCTPFHGFQCRIVTSTRVRAHSSELDSATVVGNRKMTYNTEGTFSEGEVLGAVAAKDCKHRPSNMLLVGSRRGDNGGDPSTFGLHIGRGVDSGTRHFWILPPAQMGRRSAKIATRKGAQDKKKAKLYGKMGKQIITAVKEGGPNPAANAALGILLQQAKEADIPKDIIERNIKKATDKGQQDFVELAYEVYGYGGVGLVLEVLTDNFNRAAANIRDVVKKSGAKMADSGSVLFNFKRAGVIYVKADKIEGDDLLLAAMDAGAEDVIEPSSLDDEDYDEDEKYYKVITPVEQFAIVHANLQQGGISLDTDSSGLELIPVSVIEADDEAVDLNKGLIDKLLELDDVDAVYANQK